MRLDQATAADALARLVSSHGGKVARGRRPDRADEGGEERDRDRRRARGAVPRRRRGGALPRLARPRGAERHSSTEIDAVAALESFRRDTGLLKDISFPTIAGAGPNGAIVHYRVTTQDQPPHRAPASCS